jgi:hypothetical protein
MPQICNELNLPLIDLSDDFDKHITAQWDPTKIPGDGHWSELGNRIAAEGLHRELEQLRIARGGDVNRKVR